MKVIRTKLNNGISVVVVEMPDSDLVASCVFVGAGSRYETHDTFGISHFVEHMAFKGTEKYPDYSAVIDKIERLGGDLNAGTSKDCTYYISVLRNKYFKHSFDVLSQFVSKMKLDEEELEKEKGVIVEEINQYEDEPSERASKLLGELLWGSHPLSCDVLGPRENIRKFTRKNFLDYMRPLYVAENMAIAVAGGIKAEEILPELERSFAIVPVGTKVIPKVAKMDQTKPAVKVEYFKSEQAYVFYVFKTIPHNDPRRYALDVLISILGKGMNSVLFQEIREKRGLAYQISGFSRYMTDCGFSGVYVGINKEKIEEGLEVIKKYIYKAKTVPFTKEEIKRGKEYLKGSFLIHNTESTENLANYYGRKELLYPDAPFYQEREKLIDAVTAEDIMNVANDFFVDEKQNLAIVGPFKSAKKFAKILEN